MGWACALPQVITREEDPSIVFPHFFEQPATELGAQGGTYELDGATLRALTVAANDFLPPGAKRPACWDRQESHRYRVIRHAEVIFVRIDEDPRACGQLTPAMHSGASYAISMDGRILRSLMDGQPDGALPSEPPGAGEDGVPAQPGVSSQSSETQGGPSHAPPISSPDAGVPRP
ncbi:hypothetical protein JY651_43330 [Pyxidicoccus parkwayensis]|uniref:Uncharacterized protein n=1 Tax=Pyxidicoccus parkwayensis TaxID=2813578 RepID=A0ABX7NSR3_9BACT|nr:hypothetical protein [Pyxidicoccus parkwaysis]QSQ21912.1 hypothetical protein JY651_43330 [Pyxidicoccus parkwaysis]